MPTRTLQNNRLTSDQQPAISIEVAPALHHIGTLEMTIKGMAAAQTFLFVAADAQRRIQRQLAIQFEHFLPGTNPKVMYYRYDTPRKIPLAGHTYDTDLRVIPSALFLQDLESDPEADSVQVQQFIRSKGYELPFYEEQVVTKRMMRILGEDKRAEILFIYQEPLLPAGLLYTKEEDTYLVQDEQLPLLADFERRALGSIQILESGEA
jgi:hypothetical protein